ncbi:MAG: aldo/keto reductase [Candidatus Acidiferrales bacterium]
MNKRKLGNSGLEVAPWALGGNVFGWTADEATSFKLLDAFVDAGLNLVDTADVYSKWIPGHTGGESETVIGNWLQKSGKREKVLIATKLGVEMGPGETGLSRAYVTKAVERSLSRLKTDYIDLYQAHRDDDKTLMEETLAAFGDLIKAGKVRAIGASNFKADRLAEALRVSKANGLPRYESLQPWYNLYDRAEFESSGLADLCKRENIGVIPYFGLASGFLTGKYRTAKDLEGKPRGYRVKDMMNERGFRILKALDTVAAQAKATPAQVSLAWLMGRVTAPIASATSIEQFNDLLGATKLTLTAAQVKLLEDASVIDVAAAAAQTRTPPPSSRS